MKLIQGLHITSTEKKAIKYLIDNKQGAGYTKLKRYKLYYLGNNIYKVDISSKFTQWIGDVSKWHNNTIHIKI